MESPQPVPISSTTSLDFGYLANSLAQLLEVARREIERDREAAKASLATASSILQSEIERHSGARRSRTAGLAGWGRFRGYELSSTRDLHHTIHTQDLSVVARRSPAHFSRSFKLTVGETPHAYVVRRRLEKACDLMTTSCASLSDIALSVGFFRIRRILCRLFQAKLFGQSPASWRREREIQ